jgi:hypothetical protein
VSGSCLTAVYGCRPTFSLVRAQFIVFLLTNKFPGVEIHRVGVKVMNAVILDRLDLEFAEIPFEVRFIGCKFKGDVFLKDCHLKQNFQIIATELSGNSCLEKDGFFLRMKVDKNAYFNKTTFKENVSFMNAEVGKEFSIVKCHFGEKENIFRELEVGRNAYLDEAVFSGPVDFRGIKLGGNLYADAIKFEKMVNFKDLIVSKSINFPEAIFKNGISLEWARMKHLYMINGVRAKDVNLHGALIEDSLTISNAEIDNLQAQEVTVKSAEFQNITIKNIVDLRNSSISSFKIIEVKWPLDRCEQDSILIDGLTYNSITVSNPQNYKKITEPIYCSRFNPQNYVQLEDYCKRSGHSDWADKVFIACKRRELQDKRWWVRWVTFIFWDLRAGYGRKPYRAFVVGLGIIVIGAFVFDPRYLKEKEQADWHLSFYPWHPSFLLELWEYLKNHNFSQFRTGIINLGKLVILRFLISLDQFVPAINLKIADNWQPPQLYFKTWCWLKFQSILGWILIPIGLAAIASQLR